MEAQGWLLLVILVIVSGGIAYLGDLLGYRLGKKRLSLFGLRPRTTATLISVAVGMAITIFTLIVMLALSSQARMGLFHINQLLTEQKQLQFQVERTQFHLTTSQEKLSELEASSQGLKTELESERKQLATMKASLESTRAQYKRLQSSLVALKKQNATLASRNKQLGVLQTKLEKDLKSTEQLVAAREKELQASLGQLAGARLQMDDLSKSLDRETIALEMVRAELDTQRVELASSRQQLAHTSAELVATQEQLTTTQARNQALEERRRALEQEAESLQAQVTHYQQQLAEASLMARQTVAELLGMRAGTIVLKPLDVVADTRIKQSSPQWYVRDQAKKLWQTALDNATKATGPTTGDQPQLILIAVGAPGEQAQALTGEKAEAHIATLMGDLGEDSVVQLVCVINTVRGETVPVRLQLVPDRVLFTEGEVLATVRVQPDWPLPRLYDRLAQTISERVRARIVERDPYAATQETHGVVPGEQLLEVLDLIIDQTGPVDVGIKARKLNRTLQPVELDFTVQPAAPPAQPEAN